MYFHFEINSLKEQILMFFQNNNLIETQIWQKPHKWADHP
jgi:hypothetical protein